MKELVEVLSGLGARSIKTYIQSGNAVFVGPGAGTVSLSAKISRGIKKRRGFEPHVLLLGLKDLERVIKNNPFPEALAEPATLHAGFLAAAPKKPDLQALEAIKSPSERFQLIGKVFYLHAPDGIGKSKLAANAERLLGVAMTDRNWRTVGKIWEMARALP